MFRKLKLFNRNTLWMIGNFSSEGLKGKALKWPAE
jgi:hypothetical protein